MEVLYTEGSAQFARLTTEAEIQHLLCLFQEVAREQGWQPDVYLASYPEGAVHVAVFDNGVLAGGLQLVRPDAAGRFPCHRVWPEVAASDTASLAHITILALAQEFRGNPALFWPLCVELWRYCVTEQIAGILMEATPPMLKLYCRIGWPLQIIGPLRPHWGEECFLCRMETLEFAGSLLARALRSEKYRALVVQAYRHEPTSHQGDATSSCIVPTALP